MANVKKIGMAVGTFGAALGIGFVMQNGDALASRFGADTAPPQPAPFTQASVETRAAPQDPIRPATNAAAQEVPIDVVQADVIAGAAPALSSPNPAITSAVFLPDAARVPAQSEPPVQLANLDPETAPEFPTGENGLAEIDCAPVMALTNGPAATVGLALTAPCHTDTAFTVHHQGMMFTAMTDADGKASATVPALAEVSVMIAAFADGSGAVESITVPEFASFDRAVLQWQGDTAVMLSAYEDGARFGETNHIHGGNPGDVSRLSAAEGGYMVRLGDASVADALMAEVYTFPSTLMGNAGDVMLVAEAEITVGNCGREMSAQSIQITPGAPAFALDLRMVMPECDAVGDFLILQNMFEDLTLASR